VSFEQGNLLQPLRFDLRKALTIGEELVHPQLRLALVKRLQRRHTSTCSQFQKVVRYVGAGLKTFNTP
jgi:hypothetical protein